MRKHIMDFKDKTAIVTGGARGIGRGIALALAGRGANVIIADLDEESAQGVVNEIKSGGSRSYFCETDVTQQWSTDQMVEATLEEYGDLDVLVNSDNADLLENIIKGELPNRIDVPEQIAHDAVLALDRMLDIDA